MSMDDRLRWLRSRLVSALPDPVRSRLAVPYNVAHAGRADLAFRRRSVPSGTPAAGAPDHLVCVVVDALRADAVDADLTPWLASQAGGDAVTTAPWTFPAVSSLVTGRYPHEHGAMRGSDAFEDLSDQLTLPPALPAERVTLPGLLAGAGYDTYGGFGFMMPFLALSGRFHRHRLYSDADAGRLLDDYLDWQAGRERTFAYLHLGDPHLPVDPPDRYWRSHDVDRSIPELTTWAGQAVVDPDEEQRRYREHRRRLYRASIDYVDDQLARLDERFGERGLDPAVLVVGDHGEAFWEHAAFDAERFVDTRPAHGSRHGGTPYESVARVPFRATGLGLEPGGGQRSLVDVAPTLLDAVGLEDALDATGHSARAAVPTDRIPMVEAARYGYEKKAVYRDGWKLLVSRGDDVEVGFSLPEETPAELPADVERELRAALPPWPGGEDTGVEVSGAARRRLEELGYV